MNSRTALILIIAMLAQLAIIAAFTGAMSNPSLTNAEIGLVVGSSGDAGALNGVSGRLNLHPLASEQDARRQVHDGSLPAALILGEGKATLITASASGVELEGAIARAVESPLSSAGIRLSTVDVRPLPHSDPRGLGTFLLVIGWVLGGYLGVVLLTRARRDPFGSVRRTLGTFAWLAGYSFVSVVLGVLVASGILGILAGNVAVLILIGWLISFAVCAFTAGLVAVFGMPGVVIAIGCLVVLGNPTSGGSVPDQMLAGGWRVLAETLPTNAAVRGLRAVSYFGGSGLENPVLVLALYAGITVLLALAVSVFRPRVIARYVQGNPASRESEAGWSDTNVLGDPGIEDASAAVPQRLALQPELAPGSGR